MKTIALLCVFFFSLFNRGLGQAQDIETLKKLNRNFLNAIVNRDTFTLSHILADDFMLINPGGAKRNKSDNLSSALMTNPHVVSVDIDSVEVRLLSSDVGLVSAWTTNVVEANGHTETFRISYQDVYMKRRNNWVAVAAHVASLGTH
jgi:hypothetical protein